VKRVDLADLQLLNPHLFKPLREPTVNISHAILCTFFPTLVPALLVPLPPTCAHESLPNTKLDRSEPSSLSSFSLSGVKASLGFTSSTAAPLPPAAMVPTAVAIPNILPLPLSSQLYWAAAGESFFLSQTSACLAPRLPPWAAAVLDDEGGALAATCSVNRVRYSLEFTSDGSKDAAAAAAAAAAAGSGEHAVSRM
jgi:hypothetical protein